MNFLKKISVKGYIFSILLVIPLALISILSSFSLNPTTLLIVSLTLFCLGLNVLIRIVNKLGSSLLFFLTYSILTFNISDFGIIGLKKTLTFIIAGLIFELIIVLLKKKIELKVFIGTIISVTSLPLISALLISSSLALTLPEGLIDLILISFITSLITTSVYTLIWHFIKVKKPFIKLKSYLGSLNHY